MSDRKKLLPPAMVQLVKFCIVGASNTALGYIIYLTCLFLFQHFGLFKAIDYLVSQGVMFFLTVLWSFYWNNRFVFSRRKKDKNQAAVRMIKTYATYFATNFLLSEILLYVWVNIFHISDIAAPLCCLIITVPVNYIIQKLWVYKE